MKRFDVKKVVVLSAFSAIAGLLYCFLKFPLPIFPSFLEFNFSMIVVLLVGLVYGLKESLYVVLVRFLIKIIISGTSTMYVGEVADLVIAVITVVIMCLAIKMFKDRFSPEKSIVFGLIFASLGWTFGAILANWLVLIPAYVYIAKFPMEAIISASSMIPGINEDNFMFMYLLIGVLPFNLLLSFIVDVFVYIVYKRTNNLFS